MNTYTQLNSRRKKRRLKKRIARIIFGLLLLCCIGGILYLFSPLSKLSIIYYEGLDYLTRSDIMKLTHVEENQSLFTIDKEEISKNIKSHPLVDKVTVTKEGMNGLGINVVEKNVLGCILKNESYQYVLDDGTLIDASYFQSATCQGLVIYGFENEEDLSHLALFVESISKIEPILVDLIKEIRYEPMFGDKNRFSLFLIDGNTVKVNSYSMPDKLKYYQTMADKVKELHGDIKGTYNLDVGDNFQPYFPIPEVESEN
ncbi:MAG: cell division protein FtsQ/DivIB [Turicibacter sp.]